MSKEVKRGFGDVSILQKIHPELFDYCNTLE